MVRIRTTISQKKKTWLRNRYKGLTKRGYSSEQARNTVRTTRPNGLNMYGLVTGKSMFPRNKWRSI